MVYTVKFYLGTNEPSWLRKVEFPIFLSRRLLRDRRDFPIATCDWALDSGGFTELAMHGEWQLPVKQYISEVQRFQQNIGRMDWAAPMDWMCEMHMLKRTGLTIEQHQKNTVENFLELRQHLGTVVIPVLQGWWPADYMRCIELYEKAGVDLTQERTVGVGSVCRRQGTTDVAALFNALRAQGLWLHGFGVKQGGLALYVDSVVSADSMAWASRARYIDPLPGCSHKHCTSCLKYATQWRSELLYSLDNPREELKWHPGIDISEWRRARGLPQLSG